MNSFAAPLLFKDAIFQIAKRLPVILHEICPSILGRVLHNTAPRVSFHLRF